MRRLLTALACAALLALAGAAGASAQTDPLSDADGDGLLYKWEVATGAQTPPPGGGGNTTKKCSAQKKLRKGKCVRRCPKGKVFKKGKKRKNGKRAKSKCVKKKKGRKRKGAKKRARSAVSFTPDGALAPFGANPNRKDIFVQIDYATQAVKDSIACGGLDDLYDAFASAPVPNPDGSTGITIHLDAGMTCPSRSYDLGGSRLMGIGDCPNQSAVFNYQGTNFPMDRIGSFHISGFTDAVCGGGEGGAADLNGTKSVVYTNGGDGFAMPFMHELGHNLGLDHGQYITPNRFSAMGGRIHTSPNDSAPTEVVDYQRISLPALNENALSEAAGIGAPADYNNHYINHRCPNSSLRTSWLGNPNQQGQVDWDCGTVFPKLPNDPLEIDAGTVAVDINGDGQLGVLPATPSEWDTLDYASGGSIGP